MPIKEILRCYTCDRDPALAPAYAARGKDGRLLEPPLCDLCTKTHVFGDAKLYQDGHDGFILEEWDSDAKTPVIVSKPKERVKCRNCSDGFIYSFLGKVKCKNCEGGWVEEAA